MPTAEIAHPSTFTAEQRKANMAAMNLRMASAMSRVAADPKQSKAVRAANARDAATALRMARV